MTDHRPLPTPAASLVSDRFRFCVEQGRAHQSHLKGAKAYRSAWVVVDRRAGAVVAWFDQRGVARGYVKELNRV